jgi:hypothetical protein
VSCSGRHRQRVISWLTCAAVLFSLLAQPVGDVAQAGAAQLRAQAAPSPCDDPSPGECNIDPKTDCPTAGPMQPSPGQHCVPIPAELVVVPLPKADEGCNLYIQVPLLPTVSNYEAVEYSNIGLGTRWWPASQFVPWPGTVTGIGGRYSPPKGYAAWTSSYGGCSTWPVAAWGISPRWAVSGTITALSGCTQSGCSLTPGVTVPAPGIAAQGACNNGGAGVTTPQGFYSFLVSPGHCTSPRNLQVASGRSLLTGPSTSRATGSTAQLVTTFLSSREHIEHQVTTALTHLGPFSTRTVILHIPTRLSAGFEATVTLVANIGGPDPAVTSSSQTVHLKGGSA